MRWFTDVAYSDHDDAAWDRMLKDYYAQVRRIAADLLQVSISPVSRMHGVEVGELRLPKGASVSMVIREGETMVPERRTVLRHGDDLLVVTPRRVREQTEQRLRQVSEGGRLAQFPWRNSSHLVSGGRAKHHAPPSRH